MKTKINGILTLLLAFMIQITFAQEKTISGVVSDDMGPVADISVKVKGTTVGTVTDFDGNYAVKAKSGDVLVFTHVSYETVEKIVGASDKIDVTVKMGGSTLDEIVVTAMGVSKEKKTLGYSVTTIASDEISSKAETDIARLLTGKIAGVQTQPAGGFLGSGTNVIIRSKLSITGDNRPLYIVDGSPISADRYQDLDANNILSTSVLKGLAASTLYGEEGRNGVILITTKSGGGANTETGFEIEVSNTLLVNKVGNLPEYQNKYGQGADQSINTTYYGTWGAQFNGQQVPHHLSIPAYADVFPEYQGQTVEYRAYENNVKDFFTDGIGTNTNVNIGKSGDGYSINLSAGRVDQKGFVAENTLDKITLGLGGRAELSNKVTLNTSFLFSNVKSTSPDRGMFDLLTYIPRNLDIHNLPYENPEDHSSVYYRTTQNNPLWTLKNSGRKKKSESFYAKVGLNYKISDIFNLQYNVGYDSYNRDRIQFTNKGAAGGGKGSLREVFNNKSILDNTFILNSDFGEIVKNVTFSGLIGATVKNVQSNLFGIASSDQIVYGMLEHTNFTTHDPLTFDPFAATVGPDGTQFERNTIGVYGDFKIGFYNHTFVSIAARNDWSSTVESANNSLLYPSASISFLPTSAFESLHNNKTINFLKLRFGYGTSASFPDPYLTRATLNSSSNFLAANGDIIIINTPSSRQPNPDLKPQSISEIEAGIEGKFFNKRLSLDLSVYRRNTKGQILNTNLPSSTGYSSKYINAGRIDTEGLEIALDFSPIVKKDFEWNISSNFTAYETTVIDIPTDQINIFAGVNYAVEGEPLGVFKGSYMVRDDEGNLLINPSNGKVISSSSIGLDDKIIGDPNEDWKAALTNTISYKGLSLSAQIEYTHGGDIWSQTASTLLRRGVTEDTIDREGSFIIPGVLADPNTGDLLLDSDGNSIPNIQQIGANDLYFINIMDIHENRIYDASVFRVRNVSLGYSLPKRFLKRLPFGSMSIAFNANNLYYYTPNMPKFLHIDPEVVSSSVGNGRGVDLQNEPSYKMYSMNLKLTF